MSAGNSWPASGSPCTDSGSHLSELGHEASMSSSSTSLTTFPLTAGHPASDSMSATNALGLQQRVNYQVLISLLVCLVAPAAISAYSFPSCVDYDVTSGVCWGFIRYYSSILPTASHAYNFQANTYNFTDTTRLANNAASQQDLAVDPTLQNRTAAAVPAVPNSQQVFAAYGAYPLLTAAPGQNITMTWPRTADPDGTVADGSNTVNVYYSTNTSMNAGTAFNSSKDPTLSTFMQNSVATLPFLGSNNCTVKDDKYDLASHCRATFALPGNLTAGSIYTFLWRW